MTATAFGTTFTFPLSFITIFPSPHTVSVVILPPFVSRLLSLLPSIHLCFLVSFCQSVPLTATLCLSPVSLILAPSITLTFTLTLSHHFSVSLCVLPPHSHLSPSLVHLPPNFSHIPSLTFPLSPTSPTTFSLTSPLTCLSSY